MTTTTDERMIRRMETLARKELESKGFYVLEVATTSPPFTYVAIPTKSNDIETQTFIRLIQVWNGTSIPPDVSGRLKTLAAKFRGRRLLVEAWCYPPVGGDPTIRGF